jgi:hypothetical protein
MLRVKSKKKKQIPAPSTTLRVRNDNKRTGNGKTTKEQATAIR